MKSRMKWGLAILILALGIGTFLLFYKPDTDPTIIYKGDTKPTQKVTDQDDVHKDNSIVPDEVSGDAITEGTPSNPNIAKSKTDTKYATEVEGYEKEGVEGLYVTHIPRDPDRFAHLPPPPLPPSAVPEDIPEHLKLPEEWIDGVYRNIEPNPHDDHWSDDVLIQFEKIVAEIVRDHNPKRPYAEIWDQFIEYERMYRAYGEYELGYTPSGVVPGSNRMDWLYEQTWAFPELMELALTTTNTIVNGVVLPPPYGEDNRFCVAHEIGIGLLDPVWNKITLKDGRDFFAKGDTLYEFVYHGVTAEGNEWRNTTKYSRTRVTESTPVITIDVYNTSDEELKGYMGWDYSINPLTLQPMDQDSSHVTVYPRLMGAD